jgi:peptide/nickel transport system ATP-binding protein/oligopeptide transport system ATP-binding protein
VGKTTLVRLILRFYRPTAGEIYFDGRPASDFEVRSLRRRIGYVSQNTLLLSGTIMENLRYGNPEATEEEVIRATSVAGIHEFISSLPAGYDTEIGEKGVNLSEGQKQRLAIARALVKDPDILVLDEPTSALDVFVQAKILSLISKLQEELELTYLFISHDLSVIRNISDRVAVMYLGKLVELTTNEELFLYPSHPYTKCLLSAVPKLDYTKRIERIKLKGDIPELSKQFSSCRFSTRCPEKVDICEKIEPQLREISPGHWVSCHLFI